MNIRATCLLAAFIALVACTPLARGAAADSSLIVEDLRCRGNIATSCGFMLGHIYLARGDVLDESELRNAQLRLATLRTFESVRIYLERGSERGKAVVIVDVTEADPYRLEWFIGASYRLNALRSVTAGRLAHQNLFGAGKLADLSLVTVQPLNGASENVYSASLRYADPHLFDSKRYFAIASANYADSEVRSSIGFSEQRLWRLSLTLGRRLWDFSYVTLSYGYRAGLDQRYGYFQSDGSFLVEEELDPHEVSLVYGWNTEDDLHFPTHGSSFQFGLGRPFGDDRDKNLGIIISALQFRQTWPLAGGYLSLKLAGDPSPEYRQTFNESQFFTLGYSRELAAGPEVLRGRWYLDAGINEIGRDSTGKRLEEYGLKFGVRLETLHFGLVDLYVLGTRASDR